MIEIILTVGALAFAVAARRFWPAQRVYWVPPRPRLPEGLPREVRGARRCDIASARPGEFVAVRGVVVAPAEMVAPVSRRPCVASDLVVVDPWTGDRLAHVVRAQPFTVADASGRATVDPRGAYVRITHDRTTEGHDRSHFEDGVVPPAAERRPLVAHEGVIGVGAMVLVIGVVQGDADPDAIGYRDSADRRVHIGGGGQRPALISSHAHDLEGFP